MASPIRFETPENVQVAYEPAGLGTRFSAWLLDSVFVTFVTIALFFVVAFLLSAAAVPLEQMLDRFDPEDKVDPIQIQGYVIGAMILIWGFGSFFYFTLCELFLRGQTVGKRKMKVRVVKVNGFALDPGSIFLRNVFRIIDQIPIVWIVPVLSARSQRLGDMVAGTVVVVESQETLTDTRSRLLARPVSESRFRFDASMLAKATPTDIDAVERILDRWGQLKPSQRDDLVNRVVIPIVRRIGATEPEPADRLEFLENFLAAVYRRDMRRLG